MSHNRLYIQLSATLSRVIASSNQLKEATADYFIDSRQRTLNSAHYSLLTKYLDVLRPYDRCDTCTTQYVYCHSTHPITYNLSYFYANSVRSNTIKQAILKPNNKNQLRQLISLHTIHVYYHVYRFTEFIVYVYTLSRLPVYRVHRFIVVVCRTAGTCSLCVTTLCSTTLFSCSSYLNTSINCSPATRDVT
jgi:hypothetical protein